MIRGFISAIISGADLSRDDARQAMLMIISGQVDPVQTAGFLTALKAKGENVDEMVGFVRAMREKMVPVKSRHTNLMDLCGTGGDRKGTFNISTIASLAVCAAGLPVAKHGNRSVSSKCGSADILEKIGVKIDLSADKAGRCLDEIGYAFLFAPNFHPAMKNVAPVRRALGIPTVFNILGPLCNPASVKRQLIGVYDARKCRLMAQTLQQLAHQSALVVHSADGLDEISPARITNGFRLSGNKLIRININPRKMGLRHKDLTGLFAQSIDDSVALMYSVLKGEPSIARNAVALNAGAALYIGGKSKSIAKGLALAAETIDSGQALRKLNEFIKVSNQL